MYHVTSGKREFSGQMEARENLLPRETQEDVYQLSEPEKLENRQTWFCFGTNLLWNVAVSFY